MKHFQKIVWSLLLASLMVTGCFPGSGKDDKNSAGVTDGPSRRFTVVNNGDKDLKASAKTVQDSADIGEWDVPAHSARGINLPLKTCSVIVMDADFKLTNFTDDLDPSKLGEEDQYYFPAYEEERLGIVSASYLYEPRDKGVRPYQGTAMPTSEGLKIKLYNVREPVVVNWDPVLPGEELESELGVLNDRLAIMSFPDKDMTEEEQVAHADKYLKSLPHK